MTITNRANGEQINLAQVLNSKVEAPILQTEMGLETQASATKQAVRWDEFSVKHNNDGTFKGIADTDVSATAGIQAKKIAMQKMYKKSSVSNPSATAVTYGTAIDLIPVNGYASIVPRHCDIVFGGTFGSETVTAQIVVTFNDNNTLSLTKTATATGTVSLTGTDWINLTKDGVYITKFSVNSQSTINSSAVTVTFNHIGFYL